MMGSAPAEERITGEDGVLGDRAEERDDAVAVEVKGNDEDEVFEELMDAHDSLQEEEERKSDAAISNADLDGNSGVSSDKTSAVLDGNSGVDYDEAESFEEAIGTPTVADTSVRKFGLMFAPEKVEGPEEGENVGGIAEANIVDEGGTKEEGLNGDGYEGNTEEGLTSDGYEGNTEEGLNSDGYEGHTEADVEEIHEVHANEETRDGVDELTEKLEAVFEKAESGDSVTKDIGVDEGRNNDIDEPTRDLVVVSEKSEDRDLENSTEVVVVCEGNDSVGAGGLDHNGSLSGEILHADEQNEELNENKLAETESAEVEILSAGNHPAALSSVVVDAEAESNGHVNGERQSISLGPDLASHDAGAEEPKDEEQKDVSSISGTNHQDDSNGTVKDALAGIGSHDEEKCVQHVTSGDVPVPAMEMTGSPKGEDSTDSVEVVKDIFETIEPSDRSINETLEHRPLVEEPKKETLKTNEESNEKRQSEIQADAGPGLSSVSAKPNNQAPPSAPAGLGRAAPLLEPAPRAAQQPRVNGAISQAQAQQIEDAANGEADEHDETREKLQMIRVKFLRLAHRLGQTPHNVVVAQVLYRLGLAEQLRGRNGGRVGAFSFDRASAMAEQLEASGQEPLDFSCTIMVLGKSGVGKSATINSIFDEVKFNTDAFAVGTKKVQDVVGTVQGIRVRVIDTPGLLPSWTDQRHNEKILHSVKRFIKKTPPDIVLYLDRLDMQTRDLSDMPLLRTITDIFGPSIWFNAIVVLTHAASAPPDGPNGTASSYDMFVTQRSHVVQQAIRQAAGDMRLMNPVSLVENHSACRTNRAGQRVLPNGQVWKPHLLLLSFASKILAEANTLLKLQDSPPGKPFATRSRSPPLPFLLSSLLQPRPQLKLPDEQFGDEDGLDDDLDESSDSDEENEYDELPPFKRLTKDEVSMLSRSQKKAYFDELEYREKLFMKKQLKEERRRRRMMKKMAAAAEEQPTDYAENAESAQEEASGAASVPVPMPDLALPTSFDSDNPTHRYRYLDTSNQWLVRPVLETHGWDHDVGYEGINVERLFVVREKVPVSFSGQVTKDKKDANVQMELSSSIKHGKGKATSVGFDMQTVGKDLAYTFRSETRFSNYRRNKATAGFSVTHLNDALSAGFKIEDKLILSKWFRMLVTGGAITARGDVAYGGSLDATLKDKDPLGRALLTLGLSVMDWHGDLAIGGNVQSQIPIGRSTNLIARANLNNRGAGQVSLRVNTSEQLQIALLALIPLFKKLVEEKYYLGQR